MLCWLAYVCRRPGINCDSAVRLQALLDIVARDASKWRYQLIALKSGIMVFGESSRSRTSNKQTRCCQLAPVLCKKSMSTVTWVFSGLSAPQTCLKYQTGVHLAQCFLCTQCSWLQIRLLASYHLLQASLSLPIL